MFDTRHRAAALAATVTAGLAAVLALAGSTNGAVAAEQGGTAPAHKAEGAIAQQRVTVRLRSAGGGQVRGTAILAAAGAGTSVALDVTGLPPGAAARSSLRAGTGLARLSASAAVLPGLKASATGRARATGRVLFRGREDVPLAAVADAEHVIVIALGIASSPTEPSRAVADQARGGTAAPPGAAVPGTEAAGSAPETGRTDELPLAESPDGPRVGDAEPGALQRSLADRAEGRQRRDEVAARLRVGETPGHERGLAAAAPERRDGRGIGEVADPVAPRQHGRRGVSPVETGDVERDAVTPAARRDPAGVDGARCGRDAVALQQELAEAQ